jgi:hypothetical protein
MKYSFLREIDGIESLMSANVPSSLRGCVWLGQGVAGKSLSFGDRNLFFNHEGHAEHEGKSEGFSEGVTSQSLKKTSTARQVIVRQ